MKKVLLSILCVGVATLAHAQKSEVSDAKKEWGIFQITANTKNPLDKKLEALQSGVKHTDLAIANEKSKNMPEAWSYRALFASSIATLDTLNANNSIANQKIAEEAITKAKALDTKGEEKQNIAIAETNITNSIKQRAFTAYNKKDYASALKYFNEATVKNPNDTAMYLNAGIMARLGKNYPEVIKNFKKVISLNSPNSKDLYNEIINLSLSEVKDTVGGMALLKEASAKFPDDENFTQIETQMYLSKGDVNKSVEMLDKLVAKNPKNANYQYLRGDIYYQQAVEIQNKKNKIDPKKVKEATALNTQITALLNQALPYYIKSSELDPKYAPALEAQKRVYAFKNDTANYEIAKKKLEALTPQ